MGVIILEKRVVAIAVLCLCLMSSLIGISVGKVHKVGNSAGWTTIGNVDYKKWAISKSFQLGDVIVFEYNPQFHNVMRVTHAEYKACNATSPIMTLTTGNDSITIDTKGHHFFICGVPGHCQAGQKVDINVLRAPSVAAGPSGLASLAPPVAAGAPAPSSGAPTLDVRFEKLGCMLILQLVCFVFGLF